MRETNGLIAELMRVFYVSDHAETYAYTIAAFANSVLPTWHQPHVAADVSVLTDLQSVCD